MDNIDLVDLINNPLKLGQCDMTIFIDLAIDLCHTNCFHDIQTMEILRNLNKLKDVREYFNYQDHPSISNILSNIGNMLQECS